MEAPVTRAMFNSTAAVRNCVKKTLVRIPGAPRGELPCVPTRAARAARARCVSALTGSAFRFLGGQERSRAAGPLQQSGHCVRDGGQAGFRAAPARARGGRADQHDHHRRLITRSRLVTPWDPL
eukprot:1313752-Prymnesium_polylepis.1